MSCNEGHLKIDTVLMEVNIEANTIPMTTTEFKILPFLAEKPQMVFGRFQMVSMIPGYDFEGYDSVVDAHIKNIRHKIDENNQFPALIRTEYGADYKFACIPD